MCFALMSCISQSRNYSQELGGGNLFLRTFRPATRREMVPDTFSSPRLRNPALTPFVSQRPDLQLALDCVKGIDNGSKFLAPTVGEK
jgi:hypothetical protein